MPQFVFSDPVDLNPEDIVSAETTIRAGSIVVFDRRGRNCVVIRTLLFHEAQGYAGATYTVEKGERPGEIKFSLRNSTC
jgi:hypothetical protein